MDADDFQNLYKLLRGSKSAMPVLDAKALFLDRKMVEALAKLSDAREKFFQSRSRLLKQDPEKQVDPKAKDADRQIKKLKRKQEKLREILGTFDELLPQLEKLAEREQAREAKKEVASREQAEQATEDSIARIDAAEPRYTPARRRDVSDEFCRAFADASRDDQLDVILSRFELRKVRGEDDLHGDSLYLIQGKDQSFLVCTPALAEMNDTIHLSSVIDDRPIKPFKRKDFLKLGKRRRMVLLTRQKESADQQESADDQPAPGDQQPAAAASAQAEPPRDESIDPNVLDMGAFSQLLSAAQRSGLVPGADQIAYVRDREFRMGKYDLAFQAIDALFSRFSADANQRVQRLAREDAEIAAGRVKMSPKELQAKRSRDRKQSQEIERTQRRFQIVLEGLRVLIKTSEGAGEATSGSK